MVASLPSSPVHAAAVVRAADAAAQARFGLPGRTLMTAAAAAALGDLQAFWPAARSCAVVCGPGNNGGDGYDLARLALAAGLRVTVHSLSDPEKLRGDARCAFADWRTAGGEVRVWAPAELPTAFDAALQAADVVVDALFGTGLGRPLQQPWLGAVAAINRARGRVLALDLPSGLQADRGADGDRTVQASLTSTFVGWKAGLFLSPGLAGTTRLHGLGVPEAAFADTAVPLLRRLSPAALALFPRRPRDAHKGRHGHVLVIGGDHGMPGAVRLAAEAALRAGAGRVTVATRAVHAPLLPLGCPELMAVACEQVADLLPRLATADAVVCGPGLGRGSWGRALVPPLLAAIGDRPLVLDADALHALVTLDVKHLPPTSVLTPHPGEAAALLGVAPADVQADRLASVKALAARWQAVVVLKGAASLVAGPQTASPWVCDLGNPGMGTAGMGDVLAGVCGGLAAQERCDPDFVFSGGEEGWTPLVALAVLAHAAAGDAAARQGGERGLLASDLLVPLRQVVNGAMAGAP